MKTETKQSEFGKMDLEKVLAETYEKIETAQGEEKESLREKARFLNEILFPSR